MSEERPAIRDWSVDICQGVMDCLEKRRRNGEWPFHVSVEDMQWDNAWVEAMKGRHPVEINTDAHV